jgi:hypothetical protein
MNKAGLNLIEGPWVGADYDPRSPTYITILGPSVSRYEDSPLIVARIPVNNPHWAQRNTTAGGWATPFRDEAIEIAALIQAAPDLLRTLRECRAFIANNSIAGGPSISPILHAIDTAVARAEGK